jgi:hypothetical protein
MMLKYAEPARLSNRALCAALAGGFLVLTAGMRMLATDATEPGGVPTAPTAKRAAVTSRHTLTLDERKKHAAQMTQPYAGVKTLSDAIRICQKQLTEAGHPDYADLLTEERVKSAITTAIASYEAGMQRRIQPKGPRSDQDRKSFEFFTKRVKPDLELIRDEGVWKSGWHFNPIYALTDGQQVSYDGLLLRMQIETPGETFDGFGLPIVDVLYGHFDFN